MSAAVRSSILRFLDAYPGVHVREIERRLGLSNRLASYHLGELEREHRVRRVDEAGYVRYLPARTVLRFSQRDVPLLCLMRRIPALKITLALLSEGELPHRDLSRRLRLAKASTSYHLRLLEGFGLVHIRADGRERFYRLARPAYVRSLVNRFPPLPGELDRFASIWTDLFG